MRLKTVQFLAAARTYGTSHGSTVPLTVLRAPAVSVLVARRLKGRPPRQELVAQHTQAPVVHAAGSRRSKPSNAVVQHGRTGLTSTDMSRPCQPTCQLPLLCQHLHKSAAHKRGTPTPTFDNTQPVDDCTAPLGTCHSLLVVLPPLHHLRRQVVQRPTQRAPATCKSCRGQWHAYSQCHTHIQYSQGVPQMWLHVTEHVPFKCFNVSSCF